MLSIIFLFSITVGFLTIISFKTESSHKEDLENILFSVSEDLKSLYKNIMQLLLLLIKDLSNNSSKRISTESCNDSQEISSIKEENDFQKLDFYQSDDESSQDIDLAVKDFCPEVIEIIDEEEKVA
tara:strand:- start:3617 stop:3994 length:378 start_codon:yes stop_codon:yes gene_type:complete